MNLDFLKKILDASSLEKIRNFISGRKQTILLIIFLIAIIATIYIWYFQYRTPLNSEEIVVKEVLEVPKYAEDVQQAVEYLKGIELDTTFFENPIFKDLIDFTIEVEKGAPQGRYNPFLPY